MVAALLSLWMSVGPVPGSSLGHAVAPAASPSSHLLDGSRAGLALVWPLDDESSGRPRWGRMEPILSEEETSDGGPIDAGPRDFSVVFRLRVLGCLAIDPNHASYVAHSDRSRVLRC